MISLRFWHFFFFRSTGFRIKKKLYCHEPRTQYHTHAKPTRHGETIHLITNCFAHDLLLAKICITWTLLNGNSVCALYYKLPQITVQTNSATEPYTEKLHKWQPRAPLQTDTCFEVCALSPLFIQEEATHFFSYISTLHMTFFLPHSCTPSCIMNFCHLCSLLPHNTM